MANDDEFPEVGEVHNGHICVFRGDDQPDEWIDWLEPIVSELEHLEKTSDEMDVAFNEGWNTLCNAIGIDDDSSFWEGEMISGHYHIGWLPEKEIESAQKLGEQFIQDAKENLINAIKSKSIKSIQSTEDLEDLVFKTKDYSSEIQELTNLQSDIANLDKELSNTKILTETLLNNDQSKYYGICIKFLASIIEAPNKATHAGPLIYWNDKYIYAITKIGGYSLPETSPFNKTIEILKNKGLQVVEVHEKTPVGYFPLSGNPVYGKEGEKLDDWLYVWTTPKKVHLSKATKPRVFITPDTQALDIVNKIHDICIKR